MWRIVNYLFILIEKNYFLGKLLVIVKIINCLNVQNIGLLSFLKIWTRDGYKVWHWNDIGIFWWCYRYPILGVMFPPKTHYIMNNANTMGIQWTGFYKKIRIIHLGTINCVSLLTRGHMIGKFLFLGSPILNNECSSIVNQK